MKLKSSKYNVENRRGGGGDGTKEGRTEGRGSKGEVSRRKVGKKEA